MGLRGEECLDLIHQHLACWSAGKTLKLNDFPGQLLLGSDLQEVLDNILNRWLLALVAKHA